MKTFKVIVDGQSYTVQVEEIEESSAGSSGNASVPVSKTKSAPLTEEPQQKKDSAGAAKKVVDQNEKKTVDQPAPAGGQGGTNVKAPMPGSVLEVKVSAGEVVSEGDVLLILEAMKMENELTASQAGTVSEVLVKKGDTVNSGDPLVVLL